MNNRIRGLILPIPLLLAGQVAQALGLGELKVESALEQPLKGEIKLILNAGESLDELQVRLASAADYDRVGLDPTLVPPTIALSVKNGPDGPFVEITSKLPVNEPIVSLLVEAEWPKGRLLREYTLLLDPPSYAPVATVEPASFSTPEKFDAVVEETPASETEKAHEPLSAPMAAEETPADAGNAVSAGEDLTREFPVQPAAALAGEVEITAGQTLWSIAADHKPEGVSVHQMMLAILRANPQAFIDGNMNHLRKGSILRIPDDEEARTVSHAEAVAEVAAQSQQWVAYQEKARDMVPAAYQVESAFEKTETATRSSADYELDLVPPADDSGRNQVAGTGSGAGEPANANHAELARIREEKEALEQEKQELASRVAELENIVNDQQAVLQVKDAELAKLQEQLARLNEQEQSPGTSMAEVQGDTDSLSQESLTDAATASSGSSEAVEYSEDAVEVAASDTTEDALDDVWSQEAETEESGQDAEIGTVTETGSTSAEVETPTLVVETDTGSESTTQPPATPPQSWWQKIWQWLSDNPLYAGGAALVLLLLGVLSKWMRREEQPDDEGGSFLDSIGRKSNNAEEPPTPDEGEAVSETNIDDLLERIKKEPDNVDLLYDAILYYYGEDDRENFESMAEELYARLTDPAHPKWQEVIELGQKIAPENALFGVALLTEDHESRASKADVETEANGDVAGEDDLKAGVDPQVPDDKDSETAEEFSFDLDDYMPETGDNATAEDSAGTENASDGSETGQSMESDLEADLLPENLDDLLELEENTPEPQGPDSIAEQDKSETGAQDSLTDMGLEGELELSLDDLEEELQAMELDEGLDAGEEKEPEDAGEEKVPEIDLSGEIDLGDDQDLMNFDFGEELTEDADQTDTETGAEPMQKEDADNESGESLDIGFNLDDIVPEGDAVATKLDLARAYFEMGDTEGARIMIDEVLEEGNAEQQAQARALKDEMDDA